jgi:hypothetical protein
MRMRWISAVLVAGVAGLTACSSGSSTSSAPPASGATSSTSAQSSTSPGTAPSSASTSGGSGGGNTTAPGGGAKSTPSVIGPSTSPQSGASSSAVHSFTVPSIPGDNIVSGYGTYQKIGSLRLKVTMCAKQTGAAFAVGAVAVAYNSAGLTKNVGGTVLKGPGDTECGTITFLFYTAHLKVHDFIGGNNGYIKTTGPVLTLF